MYPSGTGTERMIDMDNTKPEYKSCPFCGGQAKEQTNNHCYWIVCCDCKARGGKGNTKKEAAERWNARGLWDSDVNVDWYINLNGISVLAQDLIDQFVKLYKTKRLKA